MENQRYRIENSAEIISPALVIFLEQVEANLDSMIRIAGQAGRLRPHCKTHKMREVIELELSRGIAKHKAATIAEAEMLADCGVRDVFLAYNLVGPNIDRAVAFRRSFPETILSITVDHPTPLAALGRAMTDADQSIDVLLDLDTGQHRTGIPLGPEARRLYELIAGTEGVTPGGLHVYDGQNHQTERSERSAAVLSIWNDVIRFRDELTSAGLSVPRIVAGGTGSFPIFAEFDDPTLELSPGTCVFNDAGYSSMFPDLDFPPAAVLLTRVVSCPTEDRITLDLGYKAVASDPPAGRRVVFPDLHDAEQVLQNEEHLVLATLRAREFTPGDELIAIPWHICPTSALHQEVVVVSGGVARERWPIAARDRRLTV